MPRARLNQSTAFALASDWGSFVTAGDPGACMYSFRAGDGRPVSEAHRGQVLAYLDTRQACSSDDLDGLERLKAYISRAALAQAVRS